MILRQALQDESSEPQMISLGVDDIDDLPDSFFLSEEEDPEPGGSVPPEIDLSNDDLDELKKPK